MTETKITQDFKFKTVQLKQPSTISESIKIIKTYTNHTIKKSFKRKINKTENQTLNGEE